jgi:hypothetical protein
MSAGILPALMCAGFQPADHIAVLKHSAGWKPALQTACVSFLQSNNLHNLI